MTDSPNFHQDLTSPPRKRRNDQSSPVSLSEQMLKEILSGLGEMKKDLKEMKKDLAEIKEKQEIQEKNLKKLEIANEVQNQMLHYLVEESIKKKSFFYWNWLPIELRAHCVKQMDFRTRTKLRCSSKSELRLVDSTKLSFEDVRIWLCNEDFEVWVDNGEKLKCELPSHGEDPGERDPLEVSKIQEQFEKVLIFMQKVFAADQIDFLELNIDDAYLFGEENVIITDIIKQGPNLKVKKLQFRVDPEFSVGLEIMKRCSMDVLTETQICDLKDEELLEELLRLPQVSNVQKLRFEFAEKSLLMGIATNFLEKWIVDGSPVGKQLQIRERLDFSMDELLEPWKLKIIRRFYSKDAVILETNDPAKHIWLHMNKSRHFFVMLIVTAGSEEPDFGKMYDDFRDEE